jgi:hypothetical protein
MHSCDFAARWLWRDEFLSTRSGQFNPKNNNFFSSKISNQSFLKIFNKTSVKVPHKTVFPACKTYFKPRKFSSAKITRRNIMSRWKCSNILHFHHQVSCFVSFCKLFVAYFFLPLRNNKSAREKNYKNIRIVLCFSLPTQTFSVFHTRKRIHMLKHVTEKFSKGKKRLFGVRKHLKREKKDIKLASYFAGNEGRWVSQVSRQNLYSGMQKGSYWKFSNDITFLFLSHWSFGPRIPKIEMRHSFASDLILCTETCGCVPVCMKKDNPKVSNRK